ncbi:MAG TPA: hypothetical protein VHM30_11815 [Gemmatimonadaceae bacterium]|nr:hypothetical protein [Gemmatimonadaceae bacterium]
MKSSPGRPRARRGFALLAVLWVIVGLGLLYTMAVVAARESVATAQYRVSHSRAAWRAEGCAELARAASGEAMLDERTATLAWRMLDSVVAPALLPDMQCAVELRASGTTLDANRADESRLEALLRAAGVDSAGADSLADAILDWRDADDEPRPNGAERWWYRAAGKLAPRNGAFADAAELRLVRGLAGVSGIDTLLGVDAGRVELARAPPAVVASLPGFGDEAVARLAELRFRGEEPRELLALSAALSPGAREAMLARYSELSQLVTPEPDAWTLVARATDGGGATAEVELRLVRAGSRIAIVRRRTA